MIPESTFLSKLAPHPCPHLPRVSYLPVGTGSDEHNHNNGNSTVLRASAARLLGYIISNPHISPKRFGNTTSSSRGMEEASHLPQSTPVPDWTACCLLEMLRGGEGRQNSRTAGTVPWAFRVSAVCLRLDRAHNIIKGHHLYSLEALGLEGAPVTSTFCVRICHQPDLGSHVTPSRPACTEKSSQPRTLYADPLRPLSTAKHVPQTPQPDTHSGPPLWPRHHAHSGPHVCTSACTPQMQRANKQIKWTQSSTPWVSPLRLSRAKTDPSATVPAQSTNHPNHNSLIANPTTPTTCGPQLPHPRGPLEAPTLAWGGAHPQPSSSAFSWALRTHRHCFMLGPRPRGQGGGRN